MFFKIHINVFNFYERFWIFFDILKNERNGKNFGYILVMISYQTY